MSLFGWGRAPAETTKKETPPPKKSQGEKTNTGNYDQFVAVTGSSVRVAKAFVDHFEGNTNAAVSSFFDNPKPAWLSTASEKASSSADSSKGSSFSFMASTESPITATNDRENYGAEDGNMSGFGFMSGGGGEGDAVNPVGDTTEGGGASSGSGFNFIGGAGGGSGVEEEDGGEKETPLAKGHNGNVIMMGRPKVRSSQKDRKNAKMAQLVPESMMYSGESKPLNLNFKARKKRPKKKKKRGLGWASRSPASKTSEAAKPDDDGVADLPAASNASSSSSSSSSTSMLAGLTIHNKSDTTSPSKETKNGHVAGTPTVFEGTEEGADEDGFNDDNGGLGLLSGLSIRRQSSDSSSGNIETAKRNGDDESNPLREALERGEISESEYDHLVKVEERAKGLEERSATNDSSSFSRGAPPPIPTDVGRPKDTDDRGAEVPVPKDEGHEKNDDEPMDYEDMMKMMDVRVDDDDDDDDGSPGDDPVDTKSRKTDVSAANYVSSEDPSPTSENSFRQKTQHFREASRRLNDRLAATDNETEELQNRQRDILESIEQVKAKLRSAEEEQNSACEREDFDAAEQLNISIESKKETLRDLEKQSCETVEGLRVLVQKKHAIFIERQVQVESFLGAVDKFSETQSETLSATRSRAEEDAAADDAKLAASEARLSITEKQYENHVKSHREDKEQIENSISERVGEFEEQRKAASEKCVELEDELQRLRAVVVEKEVALAEHKSVASRTSAQISAIRKQFEQTLRRLESREAELEAERRDCEEEKAKQSELREQLDRKRKLLEQQMVDHRLSMQSAKFSKDIVALLRGGLGSLKCHDANWKEERAAKKRALESLRGNLRHGQEDLERVSSQRVLLETQIASAKAEVAEIGRQLPALEREKKLHAAKRRFREAGNAAKQIKKLKAELVDAKGRAEECETSLSATVGIVKDETLRVDALRKEAEAFDSSLDDSLAEALENDVRLARRVLRSVRSLKSDVDSEGDGGTETTLDDSKTPHEIVRQQVLEVMRAEIATAICQLTIVGRRRGALGVNDVWTVEDVDDDDDAVDDDAMSTKRNEDADVESIDDKEEDDKNVPSPPSKDTIDEDDCNNLEDALREDKVVESVEDDVLRIDPSRVENVVNVLSTCRDELAAKEKRVEEAVEAEDYDLAADLESQMSELKSKIEYDRALLDTWAVRLQDRVRELEAMIDEATEAEDYETAATCDDEMTQVRKLLRLVTGKDAAAEEGKTGVDCDALNAVGGEDDEENEMTKEGGGGGGD
eukprot:g2982.t1